MTESKTLVTVEDLLRRPDDGNRYELLDGELRPMTPPGYEHAEILGNVAHVLGGYLRANQLGKLLVGDPGIILRRNPDRVRAPDACYIRPDRLPRGERPKGFIDIVPDLIVEIVSPHDAAADVEQKVEEWLRAGVRLVWAIYPGTRSVVAYRDLDDVRIFTEGDELEAMPVLPAFGCRVAALFE